VVVKADGLAAGKGVIVASDHSEARNAIHGFFSGALVGNAGRRLVLEECLEGEEISFIAVTDGETILPLEPSQDHKRIFDHDEGPNTGGMGAYSDSLLLPESQRKFILDTILRPTIDGMRSEGMPFRGFLYAGLMMTARGPMVLEYNVRLGDPETQCLVHRMSGDLTHMLIAACEGRLREAKAEFSPQPSVCVVMAAHGYPGQVRAGDVITGIDQAEATGATVFHAGTRQTERGLESSGGRVLGVTACGPDLRSAIGNVYRAVDQIHFQGMQVRHDIGAKGLPRYN
jgi:phosphoribosylamine--glycine ligase